MAPPQITLRPSSTADLVDIAGLMNRSQQFDDLQRATTVEELVSAFSSEPVGGVEEVRLAIVDGELAGSVNTFHLPSDVREERCYIFGQVEPRFRRRGVGAALMAWAVPRAEALLRSSVNALPKYIRVDAYESIGGAQELFTSFGMRQVRWTDELLRPLTDPPPRPTDDAIDGLRIIPWPNDRDEDVREEKNIAFGDHWGSTPTSTSNWDDVVRGFGSRPDLSSIAVDVRDRVVAHCLIHRYPDDDELLGRKDGWIDSLGTLPEWRGRGVASALIARSLHLFREEGLTHAALSVDSGSPTGADRLYRSLGFQSNLRSITSQIQLDA